MSQGGAAFSLLENQSKRGLGDRFRKVGVGRVATACHSPGCKSPVDLQSLGEKRKDSRWRGKKGMGAPERTCQTIVILDRRAITEHEFSLFPLPFCEFIFLSAETGAVGHHGDNLVEKIISVLPQLPGHTNDVAVNMVELTALQNEEENQNMVAPGCLAQSK